MPASPPWVGSAYGRSSHPRLAGAGTGAAERQPKPVAKVAAGSAGDQCRRRNRRPARTLQLHDVNIANDRARHGYAPATRRRVRNETDIHRHSSHRLAVPTGRPQRSHPRWPPSGPFDRGAILRGCYVAGRRWLARYWSLSIYVKRARSSPSRTSRAAIRPGPAPSGGARGRRKGQHARSMERGRPDPELGIGATNWWSPVALDHAIPRYPESGSSSNGGRGRTSVPQQPSPSAMETVWAD